MSDNRDPTADELHFMMGEFRAELPADRSYAKNHMWALPVGDGGNGEGDGVWRFGFTAYAVRLLQDVYFLDWEITDGAAVIEKQEIGQIESQKAESSLHAPLTGRVTRVNDALLADPSAINVEKYGAGWLFELRTADATPLLSPAGYLEHLERVWVTTQRTIKGQMGK